jgi:Na+-translocating ferredoxin:NAD+ oxidoreductase RnfG subunit
MRFRFLLMTPLALAVPAAAYATQYLTAEQAQAVMFPGATFQADTRTLTPEQAAAIAKASGEAPLSKMLLAWRVSTGGWFIVDRVVGKHEFITFALGIDETGAVKDIEILDYRESYGDQVRGSAWRAQFKGKRSGAQLKLGADVKNISGATLSSKHVTDGVRRLLATYEIVLAPHAG